MYLMDYSKLVPDFEDHNVKLYGPFIFSTYNNVIFQIRQILCTKQHDAIMVFLLCRKRIKKKV